jgi:hypothetical protein
VIPPRRRRRLRTSGAARSNSSSSTRGCDAAKRSDASERRVAIYAFTAPLVVEAAERACAGALERAGAFALGDLFDARDFLRALAVSGELSLETDA